MLSFTEAVLDVVRRAHRYQLNVREITVDSAQFDRLVDEARGRWPDMRATGTLVDGFVRIEAITIESDIGPLIVMRSETC